jgi:hypothetical protein
MAKSAECNSARQQIKNLRYTVGLIACLALSVGSLFAQQPRTNNVRFLAVDVFVDSKGQPLAAYQLEFTVTNGNAKIVGIEGGEHPAFREAPHYDAKAMQQERVIMATFSTKPVNQLPTSKTRVATVHLQIIGTTMPTFESKIQTAADDQGNKILVETTSEERKTR